MTTNRISRYPAQQALGKGPSRVPAPAPTKAAGHQGNLPSKDPSSLTAGAATPQAIPPRSPAHPRQGNRHHLNTGSRRSSRGAGAILSLARPAPRARSVAGGRAWRSAPPSPLHGPQSVGRREASHGFELLFNDHQGLLQPLFHSKPASLPVGRRHPRRQSRRRLDQPKRRFWFVFRHRIPLAHEDLI